jgi:hypothetical protein
VGHLEKQNTDRCGCFSFWNAHVKSFQKFLWHPMGIWWVPTGHNEKKQNKNQSIFTLCNGLGHGHYQNWACLNSTLCGSIFNNFHRLEHYVHVKPLVFPFSFNSPLLLPGFLHHMQWRWWSLPKSGFHLTLASCLVGCLPSLVVYWFSFCNGFSIVSKKTKIKIKIGLTIDSCLMHPYSSNALTLRFYTTLPLPQGEWTMQG